MKNVFMLLIFLEKNLEIDWIMAKPNKIFKARENMYRSFQILNLSL